MAARIAGASSLSELPSDRGSSDGTLIAKRRRFESNERDASYDIQFRRGDVLKGRTLGIDLEGKTVRVKLTPAMRSGSRVRLRGAGERISRVPSDVYLFVSLVD